MILFQVPYLYPDFDDSLDCIYFALFHVFFPLPFIIFNCCRFRFISHFLPQLLFRFSLDLFFHSLISSMLFASFFYCLYIYPCLFHDWIKSTRKGLLRIVFSCSLYSFFFAIRSSSLLIILWHSIIVLHCKCSLADHISVSISTPAVDIDNETCSNCLSTLLCIVFHLFLLWVSFPMPLVQYHSPCC